MVRTSKVLRQDSTFNYNEMVRTSKVLRQDSTFNYKWAYNSNQNNKKNQKGACILESHLTRLLKEMEMLISYKALLNAF
uniref:Uncharacterized protein n=1 Tax=Helianthus annuus TaxID=4232 RepID=A0A251SES4_HELAN